MLCLPLLFVLRFINWLPFCGVVCRGRCCCCIVVVFVVAGVVVCCCGNCCIFVPVRLLFLVVVIFVVGRFVLFVVAVGFGVVLNVFLLRWYLLLCLIVSWRFSCWLLLC